MKALERELELELELELGLEGPPVAPGSGSPVGRPSRSRTMMFSAIDSQGSVRRRSKFFALKSKVATTPTPFNEYS